MKLLLKARVDDREDYVADAESVVAQWRRVERIHPRVPVDGGRPNLPTLGTINDVGVHNEGAARAQTLFNKPTTKFS